MSNIAFIMWPETGHLNSTFKIAKRLKSKGHSVIYLVLPNRPEYVCDQSEILSSQGLRYAPIFDLPEAGDDSSRSRIKFSNLELLDSSFVARLADLAAEHRVDLFVVDNLLPNIALSLDEQGFRKVLINTTFYNILKETDLTKSHRAFEPVKLMPELVLCPKEFDFPQSLARSRDFNYYHVDPSVDLQRKEIAFDWSAVTDNKPLMYCSLGSQPHLYAEGRFLFETILLAARSLSDWQFVLTIGRDWNPEDFQNIASNVVLTKSAPQLSMLRKASLIVTHGGLNSIKEAILFGVPMIVFPMIGDQPVNAARVDYHGLGITGSVKKLTTGQFHSLVKKISGSPLFKKKVDAMGRRFREIENSGIAIRMIEAALLNDDIFNQIHSRA